MNAQTIQKEIIRNIGEIMAIYPQYTVSQHMVHFLRSLGGEKAYSWNNQQLLKRIEHYREELADELSNARNDDDDDND